MNDNNVFPDSGEKIINIIDKSYTFVKENIRWAITEHDLYENIKNNLERNNLLVENIFLGFNENTMDESYIPVPGHSKIIKREGWLSIIIDYRFENEKITNKIAWIAKLGKDPEYEFQNSYKKLIELRNLSYKFIMNKISSGQLLIKSDIDDFINKKSKNIFSENSIFQKNIKISKYKNGIISINFLIYSVLNDIKLPVNIDLIISKNKLNVLSRFQKNILILDTN
ncbi:MAG: hypothetical protein CL714_01470 [Chloroflexi bacterium]|nr:hypothetical protein [Chloroflexota bacterium]